MTKVFVTLVVVVGISTVSAFTAPTSRSSVVSRGISITTALSAEKKRVVVTGLGVISGCGIGHRDFFANVVAGKSSLRTITRFDPTHYPCKIGSEVPDELFDPDEHFTNPKNAKGNDRFTHFAVAAARLALKDAELGDTPETLVRPERCGVFVGSAFGGMETFEREVLKLHSKPDRPKVCRGLLLHCLLLFGNPQDLRLSLFAHVPFFSLLPRFINCTHNRYHPSLSPLYSVIPPRALSGLNVDARVRTTALHLRVPRDRMPSVRHTV